MKIRCITILIVCLAFACKSKKEKDTAAVAQNSSEILFQVKTTDQDYLEIFEDGIIPWISIKTPEAEMDNLIGKDEVVVHKDNATLIIDYPLNNPVAVQIRALNSKGFTRKELIEKISATYKRIYKEEEASAQVKTIPLEERQGLINRNQTNGKYGIWGHDIDDLDLSSVILRTADNGEIQLELIVES